MGRLRVFGWLADRGGCGHYRLMQPLGQLQEQQLAQTCCSTTLQYGEARGYDVIVGQRVCAEQPSRLWRRLATDGQQLLVYEIDDDLWNIPQDNPNHGYYQDPGVRARLEANIAMADLVTVTTPRLAERVARINPKVTILPNWVDQVLLQIPRPDPTGRPLRIGWAGSTTHHGDIASVREPLWRGLCALDGIRVVFFGTDYSAGLPRDRVELWPWDPDFESYYRRLAGFDIGLAPLRPGSFNRSKSDLRVKELQALGIPAVYTGWGPYAAAGDCGAGLTARRPSDWPRLVRQLVQDRQLRDEISRKARQEAAGWTIQQHAHEWAQAYQEAK